MFLFKIMCKEKKKIQPKKIVYGIVNFGSIKLNKQTWYCRYCSKLKKRKKRKKTKWLNKMALQMYNAKTLDVQCKNTVRAFALLYIRKKSTNSMIEKKKKSIY